MNRNRLPSSSFRLRCFLFLIAVLGLPAVCPVLAHAATFPCTTSTLILSAQNGVLSNPSTWVGGTVPTDGNCVVVRHHVRVDRDWGSDDAGMGWIRIENGGTLDSDCASPHTIYFGSTGTDPIGSGSYLNPGANASMFGFFVSYGTVNLSCAAPNNFRVTSTDESHPWYLHHKGGDYAGCNAITGNVCNGSSAIHGAVLNLQNAALSHMGTGVQYFFGIDWDMTAGSVPANSLTLSHNHLVDLYEIAAVGGASQAGNWSITFNWFDQPRPNPAQGAIFFSLGTPTNWVVTDNTVTGSITASYLLGANSGAAGLQLLRNAVLGSSSIPFGVANLTGGGGNGGNIINYNLCVEPEALLAAANACLMIGGAATDTTTTISYNVLQGGHSGISQLGRIGFSPTINYNWISQWKEDYEAQGAIVSRTGVVTEKYNVMVMENSSPHQYMIGNLAYSGGVSACGATIQQDHNTAYGVSNQSGDADINFNWGDVRTNSGTCITNSYVRSNISYGANLGFMNENNDNTWNLSPGIAYGGAAVHHNLSYAATTAYYLNIQTTPGFDNGVVPHPSQTQYGDLIVDPQFLDPTRRPAGFDTVCGGPGTNTDLFLNLAMRSGFGGIYNRCYNIPSLWTWIRQGWAPRNKRLNGAAHDGTFIGAVAPIGSGPPQ